MAWIRQVPIEEATGQLKKIYDAGIERAGEVANIIRIMSLRPRPLRMMMDFYVHTMLGPKSALSRTEREMLATVTSETNSCFY